MYDDPLTDTLEKFVISQRLFITWCFRCPYARSTVTIASELGEEGFGLCIFRFLFLSHLSCFTFTREKRVDVLTGKPHHRRFVFVFYALYLHSMNVSVIAFSEQLVSCFALYIIDTLYCSISWTALSSVVHCGMLLY